MLIKQNMEVIKKADKEKSLVPLQNFHFNVSWVFPPSSESTAFDFAILKVHDSPVLAEQTKNGLEVVSQIFVHQYNDNHRNIESQNSLDWKGP